MKTINTLFLALASIFIFSCTNKSEVLAQKWIMKEMIIAGQKVDGESVKGLTFNFKKDGSYKILSLAGTETGKWVLTPDNQVIQTTKEGESVASEINIEDLSADKLVLRAESEGTEMSYVLVPESVVSE